MLTKNLMTIFIDNLSSIVILRLQISSAKVTNRSRKWSKNIASQNQNLRGTLSTKLYILDHFILTRFAWQMCEKSVTLS